MNTNKIYLSVLLLLVGLVVYLPTINNNFYWEDTILTKDNVHIRTLRNVGYFFHPGYINVYEIGHGNRYRPLRTVSFAVDYFFWQDNPAGYHLTNVVLNALVVLLVGWLFAELANNSIVGLLAGIIFAVHPVHTESVIFVKNRSDIICTIFYLGSLLFFWKYLSEGNLWRYILSLVLAVLAFLSKEMAVSLPLVATAIWWWQRRAGKKYWLLLPDYLLLFGYWAFRHWVMVGSPEKFPGTFWQQIRFIFTTLSEYGKLLVLPLNLTVDRVIALNKWPDIVGLIILALLVGLLLLLVIKDKQEVLSFSIFFLLINLLPISNVVYLLGRPFAEQRLYLPSVGFAGLVAVAIWQLGRKIPRLSWLVALIIVGLFSLRTLGRIADWRDEETLWKKTIATSAAPFRAYHNLAYVQISKGNYSEAMKNLKKSLEINPEFVDAYNTLGALYYRMGLYPQSIEMFEKAAKLSPGFNERVLTNLAAVYAVVGRHKEAREIYQKIIKFTPWLDRAYYNLAVSFLATKNYEEAEKNLRIVLGLNPYSIEASLRLGEIFLRKKDFSSAEKVFNNVLAIEPGNILAKKYLQEIKQNEQR